MVAEKSYRTLEDYKNFLIRNYRSIRSVDSYGYLHSKEGYFSVVIGDEHFKLNQFSNESLQEFSNELKEKFFKCKNNSAQNKVSYVSRAVKELFLIINDGKIRVCGASTGELPKEAYLPFTAPLHTAFIEAYSVVKRAISENLNQSLNGRIRRKRGYNVFKRSYDKLSDKDKKIVDEEIKKKEKRKV